MNTSLRVEIYPVGLLRDWQSKRLKTGFRYLWHQVRRGNWRAVKNYFNGYLAEIENLTPDWGAIDAGSGWTRSRSLKSLTKNVAKSMLQDIPN